MRGKSRCCLALVLIAVPSTASETCQFPIPDGSGTNITVLAGDPVDKYLPGNNLCGDDYPCLCAPDAPDQVICPYCFYATQEGGTKCGAIGEKTTFTDENGSMRECECQDVDAGDEMPQSTCVGIQDDNVFEKQTVAEEGPPDSIPTNSTGTCDVELDDGSVVTFQAGQSLGSSVVTRCFEPENFPCYCNPSLKSSVNPGYECPYCSFALGDGTLLCSRHDETIAFNDGPDIIRQCSCQINTPGEPVTSSCETSPRSNPMDPPFVSPVAPPAVAPPVTPPSGITGDGTNCLVDGTTQIADGDSFGTLVTVGECGPPEEWPAFCVADGISDDDGDVMYARYPYCVFSDTFTTVKICALDGGTVEYVDSSGVPVQCSCAYRDPASGGSETSCAPINPSPVDAPEAPPVASPEAAPPVEGSPVASPEASPITEQQVPDTGEDAAGMTKGGLLHLSALLIFVFFTI